MSIVIFFFVHLLLVAAVCSIFFLGISFRKNVHENLSFKFWSKCVSLITLYTQFILLFKWLNNATQQLDADTRFYWTLWLEDAVPDGWADCKVITSLKLDRYMNRKCVGVCCFHHCKKKFRIKGDHFGEVNQLGIWAN